ncbi:MAG: hypothetical protein ACK6DC_03470, partial [Planctomycetota bacterium]
MDRLCQWRFPAPSDSWRELIANRRVASQRVRSQSLTDFGSYRYQTDLRYTSLPSPEIIYRANCLGVSWG